VAFSAQHSPCLSQGEWSETTGCGDSGRGEEDIVITIFKRKSFKAKNLAGGGRFLHYKYPLATRQNKFKNQLIEVKTECTRGVQGLSRIQLN
jgi:hypothetical protein